MTSKARHCKRTKRILPGYDIACMEEDTVLDGLGIVDRMKSYTDLELAEMKMQDDNGGGDGHIQMPALTAGSFGAFKFGDNMPVQTINPGQKMAGNVTVQNNDDTYKLGVESEYSIFTQDSIGFADYKEDEVDGNKMMELKIEMPQGGLEGMATAAGRTQTRNVIKTKNIQFEPSLYIPAPQSQNLPPLSIKHLLWPCHCRCPVEHCSTVQLPNPRISNPHKPCTIPLLHRHQPW